MKETKQFKLMDSEALKCINGGGPFNPFDGISKHEVAGFVANILGPPVSAVYSLGYLIGRLEG